MKIWSKTPSYVYETCKGHVSALVWQGLNLGTSNTQKHLYWKQNILLDPRGSEMFFLYVVLAVLWGHVGRYDLRPQAMCIRPARAMWVLWFERVWSLELPTLKKEYNKKYILLDPRGSEMFFPCVVLAVLRGHVGRYDLRPQAMCIRPARAMWVLWFERVWSLELPTLKKEYNKKCILLGPRGSEMFFPCVVLAVLRGHVGRYDLRPQAMCMRPARAMRVLWFERVWSWEHPTLKKEYNKKCILLDPRGSEMFFLYVVLAVLWGHVGRYDLRPQTMCMRPARAMWVLWFERVWSWELPTLEEEYSKTYILLDPRGSEMFFLYVVLTVLWGHVGRYDLRPQAMCMRPARAMWVLWFERVWGWELPTLKKEYNKKYILLDPRGSEMFFPCVVLAVLWGHVRRYDLRPQAMCIRPARAMWVLWFERVWSWELPTLKKEYNKKYILLDPRGSEMFFLYVVLAVLWGHVGRYDLRPQTMCMRPARAMWVLWFERVWSWELPTLKEEYSKKYILLDPRGSEMVFLYVVLADLWGHVRRYQKLALNKVYTYLYIYIN